jgi:DNA-directed RNA polymerase specialized sigma24 family protein
MEVPNKLACWRNALGALAEDFLDLFASPPQPFPEDVTYPTTPNMEALVREHCNNIVMPERSLLLFDEIMRECDGTLDERKLADWAVLYEWEILSGVGNEAALNLSGGSYQGMRGLALAWGAHLADVLRLSTRVYDMVFAAGDLFSEIFNQIPPAELGEACRQSITPGYVKAQASVQYARALYLQNAPMLHEAQDLLQATDEQISHEIAISMSGMANHELGEYVKSLMSEVAAVWQEFFSTPGVGEILRNVLPETLANLAWYLGYCFRYHLQQHPSQTKSVLDVIKRRGEIDALMEQYRWIHGWGGDRDQGIAKAWRSVAPRFFRISGNVEDIKEDADQERLIGVAHGLEGYCRRNPAAVGLMDGAAGGLKRLLAKAGRDQEMSWERKQLSIGNKALTDAYHPEAGNATPDKNPPDEIVGNLGDDGIFNLLQEYPADGDEILNEVVTKERCNEWLSKLTQRERTAVELMLRMKTQQDVAKAMGIGQPQVSQLLSNARRKFVKTPR